MSSWAESSTNLVQLGNKIAETTWRRLVTAKDDYLSAIRSAWTNSIDVLESTQRSGYRAWADYCFDWSQRWVLFADTLRQRGNDYLAHERAGKPPVLVFDYGIVVDGRKFARPVNYALVRITPPRDVTIDDTKRPFVIIDPRAGHGPGIGGFKQDSQVGVALQAGHPVYFMIFFPEPEPGQTLPDVCAAEAEFIEAVAERHPRSPKPVLVGNCQGGWASMMLAASRPDLTGAVVINGAPMSYWSGNWHGGEGENPMRYAGGLCGGVWPALWLSDLGNGEFDGAHLVVNFENLNPANTLWTKYYHLFSHVDTEPPRFLEFERWWGGYSLMNEAEIRWIVDNLFVGNKLARGDVKAAPHQYVDLKAIRAPIIIFSSAGDNITPPQQALNWIADVYTSTEEIKANGQTIVGLLHPDVGHLGIFVSGRVAKKEHSQIVEVLKYIESLRPGMYLMEIEEAGDADGTDKYKVTIEECRLEDLRRINKLNRRDEQPFEVVSDVSMLAEKMYTLGVRPCVRPFINDAVAEIGRVFHPLRWQRWIFSDLNPWMWPVPVAANAVKASRQAAALDNSYRQIEKSLSDSLIAMLNLYRDLRDAASESLFFQVYGTAVALGVGASHISDQPTTVDPRQLPIVQSALASIGTGGYPEAIALIAALIGSKAGKFSVDRLELIDRFIRSDEVLSKVLSDDVRRIKAEQGVVAELEPERGLRSIPALLANPIDRLRAIELLADVVDAIDLSPAQRAMADRVRDILDAGIDTDDIVQRETASMI